jgi:hypothetical protein
LLIWVADIRRVTGQTKKRRDYVGKQLKRQKLRKSKGKGVAILFSSIGRALLPFDF